MSSGGREERNVKSEMIPAGGLLLEELGTSVLEALLHGKEDPRKAMRDAGLEVLLGGKWRGRLADSMRLADRMLEEAASALRNAGYVIVVLGARLRSPGLVGMGSGLLHSVFEVGLEMDWLLGLPKYPGSTLKGALRSTVEALVGDELAERLFGRSSGEGGEAGKVVVLDSYPVGCMPGGEGYPCLVLTGDVITPHYYSGGEPVEAEYEAQPRPVQHIAIAPGTVFKLVLGVKEDIASSLADSLLDAIKNKFNSVGDLLGSARGPTALAVALGLLAAYTMSRGFAARSGKGYNIMEPLTEEELRNNLVLDVVSMLVRVSLPQEEREEPARARRGRWPRRGGPQHSRGPHRGRRGGRS